MKTNVGHLESAAGVAGLIKVVLGLGHGVVPGQLHWERPSEHVRWSELPLEVVTESREWEPIAGRRIAGVSSFGFSGTNAHVVVESWEQAGRLARQPPREEVLVVTARTEAALRALAERYAEFLSRSEPGSESDWSEICYTAAVGRAVFGERLAVVAESKPAAAEKLGQWLRGVSVAGVIRGRCERGSERGSLSRALRLRWQRSLCAARRWTGPALGWAEAAAGGTADATPFSGSVTGSKRVRRSKPRAARRRGEVFLGVVCARPVCAVSMRRSWMRRAGWGSMWWKAARCCRRRAIWS